jgi:HAE1 family hydrophobic/amphiphilic exporter-1
MDILGFSLNAVSLLAITLVTGILVDDAIVEIENIVRHMRMGKSAYRLAPGSGRDRARGSRDDHDHRRHVRAGQLHGRHRRQYFRQFGLTVAIAVTFSLLVARLITPLLAAYFLRARQHRVEGQSVIMGRYLHARVVLRNRFVTLALGR